MTTTPTWREALEFAAETKSTDWPERCQKMVDMARKALMSDLKQKPTAWALKETIEAKGSLYRAPLWFTDPQNSAWVPLYTVGAPQQAEAVPTIYVSRGQLENLKPDPEDAAGTYLPVRKTPKGKFTHPLFAAPQQAEAVPPGWVLVPVSLLKDSRWRIANLVGSDGAKGADRKVLDALDAVIDAAIAQQKGQP